MSRHHGTFQSKRWGTVHAGLASYMEHDGPIAVVLTTDIGEPLATLSVNLYKPQCSHDSRDLPRDCFFVKTWGGNEELAVEALASGLFRARPDLCAGRSGFVEAPVWQVVA